jgi:hypothetical protein
MEVLREIDPNEVQGRTFRVPSIIGLGSGDGFDFAGIHLPLNWQEAIPDIQTRNTDRLSEWFRGYCESQKLSAGPIRFDEKTGVITQISIRNQPNSHLYLAADWMDRRDGVYKGENVRDLRSAIVLQRFGVIGLMPIWEQVGWGEYFCYMDGEPGRYYSQNLKLPEGTLEAKGKDSVTNQHFQKNFALRASNIAGRFGLTLRHAEFDKRGVLQHYQVNEGDACTQFLEPDSNSGEYRGHNIDNAVQIATLHGIGAAYINFLWRQKLGGYYSDADH